MMYSDGATERTIVEKRMGKRILIADDSANTRGILRFMLQSQGFILVEAENGEEALAKAASSAPDLIILDGMMPKKSGFDACRELKADPTTSKIPVILLSAIAPAEPNTDWARESPADRYMVKPFQMKDLLGAIESLLGMPLSSETALRRRTDLDPRPIGTVVIRPKDAPPTA
jgi:CheY-like chemotaxis protein